jgi:hypothetical protein
MCPCLYASGYLCICMYMYLCICVCACVFMCLSSVCSVFLAIVERLERPCACCVSDCAPSQSQQPALFGGIRAVASIHWRRRRCRWAGRCVCVVCVCVCYILFAVSVWSLRFATDVSVGMCRAVVAARCRRPSALCRQTRSMRIEALQYSNVLSMCLCCLSACTPSWLTRSTYAHRGVAAA